MSRDDVQLIIASEDQSPVNIFGDLHADFVGTQAENGWSRDFSIMIRALKLVETDAKFVIICRDEAVSNVSPNDLLEVVYSCMRNYENHPFDLLYLSKWLDRCDLHANARNVGAVRVVETLEPHGLCCLMLSPSGISKFLSTWNPELNPHVGASLDDDLSLAISEGKFIALTTSPNLVSFDTQKRKNDKDFEKTHECVVIDVRDRKETKREQGLGMLWFVVTMIVIILVIWGFCEWRKKRMYAQNPRIAV